MDIINRNDVLAFTTKDTSTIREILAPRNSAITRQSLAEATLPPRAETIAHVHPVTEEIYYILAGRGLMAIDDETRPVCPGDGIAIPAGYRHQVRNTGEEPLVFLCCCVPAYENADTVLCEPLL